ncbi:TetR/AcrR family transcriptional regulator [Streptomyces iconiensis]|uniref:TetR/AcrR family transcriptional regulator n=1 Tax=Streptomyces iconiensis TaxID=1384038 RepID=A0ABT7A271_9ACTN|nr:TetR/AcrR family transcriptional regulator [Streptomyces iconiensis]MDJ1135159.1 TetR/AcrR family transcriptional regulator [Streptomyces iconiensis]
MPATQSDTRLRILDAAQQIMAHKGFAAVGINEVLTEAGVPKGSFYHYFGSKDAFGEALLNTYFAEQTTAMDRIFAEPDLTPAERLLNYLHHWQESQSADGCQGKCLAVKLGAEVSDLSEPMRLALKDGTTAVIDRLERILHNGSQDGSLTTTRDTRATAQALYTMWLGASVMAKIHREPTPFDNTMETTRQLLHL